MLEERIQFFNFDIKLVNSYKFYQKYNNVSDNVHLYFNLYIRFFLKNVRIYCKYYKNWYTILYIFTEVIILLISYRYTTTSI